MECRSRVLSEVLPAGRAVLRESSQIHEYFGDSAEIRNCLNVVTAHFFARLKSNAFNITLTQFAFSPFGRSEIRATEQTLPDAG
jgi:hypothetical protein